MNSPIMRKAKMKARERLERRSPDVMPESAGWFNAS
jgi:hypothetical protein